MAGPSRPGKTARVAQRWASQGGFDVRFDWGVRGLAALRGGVAAVVVVDVLRFTTAVDVAVSGGVAVYPYPTADASAAEFARARDALLAGTGPATGPSLSPGSLRGLPAGSRLVLPSPNGAAAAWAQAEGRVARALLDSASGRELVARGCEADVACAAQAASNAAVPLLQDGAYRWNAPS